MNQLKTLVPIFLSSIVLIVVVVRDLVSATTTNTQNDIDNDNDNEKKIIMIVLSFISSSVVLLFASYIIRPPYSIRNWWLYIVALLVLVVSPFGLVILRLFVAEGYGVERGLNMFIILSAAATMLYTFGAAGGIALFGK
jgi:hypothetical protein